MASRSAIAGTALLAGLLCALASPVLAQEDCGPRYLVLVKSEGGNTVSLNTCAVGRFLIWARFDPLERGGMVPTEDLGHRYIIVITRLDPGQGPTSVREDFYPGAAGGPLVYAAPGQIFAHPVFGGRYTVPGGWASVDGTGYAPSVLRQLGAPIPDVPPSPSPSTTPSVAPTGTRATPTSTEAAAPASPGTSSARGPDVVTVLFLAAVAGAIVLLVLRRRGPTQGNE